MKEESLLSSLSNISSHPHNNTLDFLSESSMAGG
jgi:hypothetical protein